MSGMSSYVGVTTTSNFKGICTTRCCWNQQSNNSKKQTPQLLKLAVSGLTEFLRIFSNRVNNNNNNGMDKVITKEKEELSVSGVDDVLGVLKSDYDNAYFVTGIFSSSVYAADCLFEDPTIKFRGTELYSRNIQLLVPFFEQPSIILKTIEKGIDSDRDFVLATWSLRTYLKLPWRPLIAVEGSTIYDLNDEYKVLYAHSLKSGFFHKKNEGCAHLFWIFDAPCNRLLDMQRAGIFLHLKLLDKYSLLVLKNVKVDEELLWQATFNGF